MAFGQGETLVTPLELANEYATFANGGTRYAPQVAAAVVTPSGRVVKRFPPRSPATSAMSPMPTRPSSRALEGAIQNPAGTAYQTFAGFPLSEFPLAGKTGTATTSSNSAVQPTALLRRLRAASAPPLRGGGRGGPGGLRGRRRGAGRRAILDYLIHHPVGPVDYHPHPPA